MARPRGIKQPNPNRLLRAGVSQLSVVSTTSTGSTGVKISELPLASAATATDQIEINQGGTSRSITFDRLLDLTGGGGAGIYLPLAGGTLTGDLTVDDGSGGGTISTSWLSVSGWGGMDFAALDNPLDTKNANWQVQATTGSMRLELIADDWSTIQAAWTFARDGSTTLPGALAGTFANFIATVEIDIADGQNAFFAHGDTKGVRIVPTATHTLIQAVAADILSIQPLQIQGSTIELLSPLTGTTATFTGTVFAPGAQIQMVSTQTGAVATGTTVIPYDDTIPQITEGDQYMTLAITPKSATSQLVIEVIANVSNSVLNNMIVALFQDATANALAVSAFPLSSTAIGALALSHTMTSGTTSAITFRVRAGGNLAGTTTFNGSVGARFFGGVLASSIVIREMAV